MCPLCYGAMGALLAAILGPLGLLVAKRDPLIVGSVVVLAPLAALQAAGKYLYHLEVVKYLWLGKIFVPWWFYAAVGGLVVFRLVRAWRLGRIEKLSAEAKAFADDL